MIARRDFIFAGGCLAAAAASVALKPRKEVTLLRGALLADAVPRSFGGWVSQDTGDPLAVNGPGTLSAKLYNELVSRVYMHPDVASPVAVLLAYGGRQSDELQLHRPEVCYPAFGYALVKNEPLMLPVGSAVTVPARRLVAEAEGRRENIIYWSRMGELLPQSGSEQREARLENAMRGLVPDGLLSRFSVAGGEVAPNWVVLQSFIRDLILAVPPAYRAAMVGTERASRILAGSR